MTDARDGDRFTLEPGDSPLQQVPADYAGGGEGRWFVLPAGPDAGRKLYHWERRWGDGDGPTVLLVHGNPECSYTYRKVVRELVAQGVPDGTRLVAVDHLGFGRSDQASFEMVDVHHAANLRQLVAALELRDVTLVVHDWGGPIGIGAFLDAPDLVSNLVVLNSTIFPMPAAGPTYETYPIPGVLPWARTPSLVPDRLWGLTAAFAVSATPRGPLATLAAWARTLAASRSGDRGPDAAASRVFREQFTSTRNVRSSKRLVRQTPVWGHGYRYTDPRLGVQDTRGFYRDLRALVAGAWGPAGRGIGVAGIFGAWDPLAKPAVLAQWCDALPQLAGDLQVFDGVSHFVEEHRPAEIAAAIRALVDARRRT